jgi:DNA-binding MarR family transcriptional regulator
MAQLDGSPPAAAADQIEAYTSQFAALLGPTLHDLKRAAPPPTAVRAAADRAGLSKRHWPAMLAVAAAGPISVSELAGRLGLRVSSTSTIVAELSRAGLVQRAEDEHDHRRTLVHVHEDFREVMDAWLEAAFNPIRETLGQLSPEARQHFLEGWQILHAQAARAATGNPTGSGCRA